MSYTVGERDHGNVCGLTNWRRYHRRAQVLHVEPERAVSRLRRDVALTAK
ncbi:hypothetical protein HWE02_15630 [Pseudomonas oryzihabitans]|nr:MULTISPECIES: hypothetical protein [Pseudomonas]MCI1010689.1 hypothetical protein [Pseudomonas oryzihabitans]